jgi:signal transduction histidine kinase
MPTAAFLLGVLSLVMLVWTDRIDEKQRDHFALANALMDLRISLATSHLWLEEAITGNDNAEMDRARSDVQEATRLLGILLRGGESEYGLVVRPVTDAGLRRSVEEVGRLLSEWNIIFQKRSSGTATQGDGEGSPIETHTDAIFDDFQRTAAGLERAVEERLAAEHAKSRRLLLGILLAWSGVVLLATIALWRWERMRRRAARVLQRAKDNLEARVSERTTDLRGLNELLNEELNERQKTEQALRESQDQLRFLSAKLLMAQETERKRIAAKLHDEIGHSLVLTKFRLGFIQKELTEDQSAAKQECSSLSQFIDQAIEDIRRLSRDLRPSVLDDLGLSGALRWLADNCIDNHRTTVAFSVTDVDHRFSRDAQVVLYRIAQEALTNAAKHAQAEHVSVSAERNGERLSFVVADDGVGFDVKEAVMKNGTERGLGLATMDERARMLRGSLDVWSEEGKGTRVTLSVPVRNAGDR